jgi:PAS domain S-box-containing protein
MKLGLTTRIILFFVFLAAMLLTSVGVLSYRSGNESLKAAVISEMLAAAVEKEAALDIWIEERLNAIAQISSPADVAEKAATLLAAPPASEAARSAHAVLLQELEPHLAGLHCPYLELFVLEPESGKVMASTSPAQEGKFKLGHPYFDNGKKGLYLQAPYHSADLAAPAMTAAIPLRAADGRVVAVLAARLDLAALNTIAQRRTGLRQTDDSFLFNAEQFPVTQPRFIHEPVVLRRKLDTEAIRLGAARHSGVTLAPDYRGVPSIAVYRWSARRQVGLIVKIDQAEALAPARAFGWMVVRISGLALLAAVGLAFLLARTITRPLQTLHDGVRRFAEGNFQEPLLESSGDEVGLLTGQFNAMAARVVERTADLARVNEALKVENAERKRAELETQHQAAFARFNPNPVLELSAVGEINYFNEAAEEMARTLGLANPAQMLPPTTAGMVRECLASGKPMLRVETPIGPRVLSWSFFSVKFSNTVHGYAGDITERKRAEESLRLQSAALEAAANAIVITDHNGTIQSVNPAFTALTGYTAQEAVGQNTRILKGGKQDEAFYQKLWQTISSGQVWTGELTNRRKDGSLYAEEMTITPLQNADGVIIRYIAIKQDISERKRVEKRLEWLSRFPSENPNPVLRVSAQGVLEYANAASDTLLPTMGAEVGGTIKAEWQARIGETLAKGHSVNLEFQAGDRTFSASLSPVVNRGYVNLYARDITKRKQAEKALRESDEKFQQLADNITDAFWIRSPDMREVHYVSPAFERIWGRSVKSLYANPHQWADFILPEDRERVLGAFAALAGDARGLDIDYRILWPNGEIRWVRVRGFQVRDATDKLIRHVGIVTDITERKRAEAELENVHQQLVEASREGGMAEIATDVLHNVGNVLNSVNISTGLIVQSVKKSRVSSLARVVLLLQEHAHDLGEFITNDSRGKHVPAHLAQLSKHLLAEQETNVRELASLRQNVEHIKEIVAMQQNYATFGGVKEMINVAELVEDSLRLNEGALAGQRVEIIREFETVPPLNLEKHKFLQIMVNLLRNAKHACQDSERPDKRLTVRVANGEGRVRISVIDNGVGIPPENLTRIFNHGFTTRKDGHGFGLHSGALAAKEMGGSLTVHSDGPGQGATFVLELPCPAREDSHE